MIRPCDIIGNEQDRLPAQILDPIKFPAKKDKPATVSVDGIQVPITEVLKVNQPQVQPDKIELDTVQPDSIELDKVELEKVEQNPILDPVESMDVDTVPIPRIQVRAVKRVRQQVRFKSESHPTVAMGDKQPIISTTDDVVMSDVSAPSTDSQTIAERILSHPRRRRIFRPFESVMYLQEQIPSDNSQQQECRGGVAHITLESSVKDKDKKVLVIPIKVLDDLKSNARGDYESESSRALESAFTFCASTEYRMTNFRFMPNLSTDESKTSIDIKALTI
jgi:hypothetical protein